MIGVDWGTSSFRAVRLAADGTVVDRLATRQGILSVPSGGFAAALRAAIGPWLDAGERRVMLCGMVGSRQGWQEAPYLPCPAGPAELAAGLVTVPFDDAAVRLVPGLLGQDAAGIPEVMRGEETQIVGLLDRIGPDGLACMPGSHCKWVRVRDGRITGFTTHMTGEAFAALRGHTILGRMMAEAEHDPQAFAAGVARASDPGGLLHHLFGVRTLALTGRLAEAATASYLSGLLIGHEVEAAMPEGGGAIHLIGDAALCDSYARAIAAGGGTPVMGDPDAAFHGLALLGGMASWT
jgi:2-dehydro-3-deoxygalactonokinase